MTEFERGASPKARPILMSGPMIRELLRGRKTQTRRIIKPQPVKIDRRILPVAVSVDDWAWTKPKTPHLHTISSRPNGPVGWEENCPFGKSGDLLWVRETWRSPGDKRIAYQADGRCGAMIQCDGAGYVFWYHGWLLGAAGRGGRLGETFGESLYGDHWRPSIHMPRWASRLTLELTSVRVERLKDISEEDAIAEGLEFDEVSSQYMPGRNSDPRVAFRNFFAVTNDFGPGLHDIAATWVWALSFRVHQQNINAFLQDDVRSSQTRIGC